jgi:hypothetical protein
MRRRNSPDRVTIALAIGVERDELEPVERIVALAGSRITRQSSAQRDRA